MALRIDSQPLLKFVKFTATTHAASLRCVRLLLQDTETESYVNTAEPWKQGVGGLVAPRTFAARFFVTRYV